MASQLLKASCASYARGLATPEGSAHCKGPQDHLLTARYACFVPVYDIRLLWFSDSSGCSNGRARGEPLRDIAPRSVRAVTGRFRILCQWCCTHPEDVPSLSDPPPESPPPSPLPPPKKSSAPAISPVRGMKAGHPVKNKPRGEAWWDGLESNWCRDAVLSLTWTHDSKRTYSAFISFWVRFTCFASMS